MNSPNHNQKKQYADEINLLEFFISIKKWILFFFRYRYLLLFSIFLATVGVTIWYKYQPIEYRADLTLMLSDDIGSQVSGLSGILGQFGLPVSSGKYNIDKLLEIAQSRAIIEVVLFNKKNIGGQEDYIANHIIKLYALNTRWTKKSLDFESFRFNSSQLDSFSNQENYALKNIYKLIVGSENNEGLLTMDYGRDHYIMTSSFASLSDTLSVEFVKRHFVVLKEYYTSKAIEKQRHAFNLVQAKRDSINNALKITEMSIAGYKDRTVGSFSNFPGASLSELNTQSILLKTALAKAEENLAIASFALESNTPLIQLIDEPIYPIESISTSWTRILILSIMTGFIIFLLLVSFSFLRTLEV